MIYIYIYPHTSKWGLGVADKCYCHKRPLKEGVKKKRKEKKDRSRNKVYKKRYLIGPIQKHDAETSNRVKRDTEREEGKLGERLCVWGLIRSEYTSAGPAIEYWRIRWRYVSENTKNEVRKAEGVRQDHHECSWNCVQGTC